MDIKKTTGNKRFRYDGAKIFDGEEFLCCTLSIWVEQLVDLLNTLYGENMELKSENNMLKNELTDLRKQLGEFEKSIDIRVLVVENQQLKMEIEELEKKNEQLKKENKDLQDKNYGLKQTVAQLVKESKKTSQKKEKYNIQPYVIMKKGDLK